MSIFSIHALTVNWVESLLRGQLAYLDPGTGSYLIQLLVAGLLGVGFVIKVYWNKIVLFFRKLFTRGTPARPTDDSEKSA